MSIIDPFIKMKVDISCNFGTNLVTLCHTWTFNKPAKYNSVTLNVVFRWSRLFSTKSNENKMDNLTCLSTTHIQVEMTKLVKSLSLSNSLEQC